MTKLQPIERKQNIVGFYFNCPGCQGGHAVHVRPYQNDLGASWDFNMDFEKPTFTPSIASRVKFSPESGKPDQVCHIFVTNGKIQFLSDCTHSLAGQTVDMPDLEV